MFEVLVVGGGPAGLNAAQTLGRQRRRALLVDSGAPRNAPASEMHMFLSRDGFSPAALRRIGRAELDGYPTGEVRDGLVTALGGTIDGFPAEFADGTTARARRVILATGQVDVLPEIDGVAGLFGQGLYHCPFCHDVLCGSMAVDDFKADIATGARYAVQDHSFVGGSGPGIPLRDGAESMTRDGTFACRRMLGAMTEADMLQTRGW